MVAQQHSSMSSDPIPSNNFSLEDVDGVAQWVARFHSLYFCSFGSVRCDIIALDEAISWLDALKNKNATFTGDCEDEDFDVIDSLEVQSMMRDYLHKTMAYSVVVMDEDIADSWARSFVESFTRQDSTGVTWYSNRGDGWNPVTEATFDFCVVVVDSVSNAVGYLLITDED